MRITGLSACGVVPCKQLDGQVTDLSIPRKSLLFTHFSLSFHSPFARFPTGVAVRRRPIPARPAPETSGRRSDHHQMQTARQIRRSEEKHRFSQRRVRFFFSFLQKIFIETKPNEKCIYRVEQRSPPTVYSGGKQEFECEIGLFRRLPGTELFSSRIFPGNSIELGEEIQLRSIVRSGDGQSDFVSDRVSLPSRRKNRIA